MLVFDKFKLELAMISSKYLQLLLNNLISECLLYCQNEQKCLQNTINSINHVLASPIVVFISFITTDNDSARVIACLIHRDNHLIKYGKFSLMGLFGKVYVF